VWLAPGQALRDTLGTELSLFERLRRLLVLVAILGGTLLFARIVDEHYPIEEWLFFRYAAYWGVSLLWVAGAVSFGNRVIRRALPGLPLLEHLTCAFGAGVLGFVLAMAAAGSLQQYRPWLFWALPFAFLLIGLPRAWDLIRDVKWAWRADGIRDHHWFRPIAILFGCGALALIYFVILTPKNVQYDSYWKHMAIAEDFVAHGGVRRFPEGWLFASRPHSTSFLYVWAFLSPFPKLFDRMELCAHLEFVVFAFTTLVGIPAVVRRLAPQADARMVWAARFLFPGVFLYDSSLSGGADHFGAMYGPVIFLLTARALPSLQLRTCGVLGAFLGGALMVKETTALLLVPFPVLCLILRFLWLSAASLVSARLRRNRGNPVRLLLAPCVAATMVLIISSPYWLKNYVYYGDPLYPLLNRIFTSTPFSELAAYRLEWAFQAEQSWKPPRTTEGLLLTLRTLFTFSFVPNNWAEMHGSVPVFGSLFTLLLAPLVFLRRTRTIWWLVAWIHLGLFAWYWTHHQDRYLQAIVPLMAAVTAAALVLIWHSSGWLVKTACSALVLLQVVWGGDVYFIQTHSMSGSPVKAVLDLLKTGFQKNYRERLEVDSRPNKISAYLPKGARVLLHEDHIALGMQAEVVHDFPLRQYGINYGTLANPRAVYNFLKGLGVSHIYRHASKFSGVDTVAGDIMFFHFATFYSVGTRNIGGVVLSEMPQTPPVEAFNDTVVVMSCGSGYREGSYRVRDLSVPCVGPMARQYPSPRHPFPSRSESLAALATAGFVVADPACAIVLPPDQADKFQLLTQRRAFAKGRAYDIYGRKP